MQALLALSIEKLDGYMLHIALFAGAGEDACVFGNTGF